MNSGISTEWLARHLQELFLTAIGLMLLQHWAQFLVDSAVIPHLTERYGKSLAPQSARALLLNATAGAQLSLIALTAWCALLIGRLPLSLISRLALIAAIWVGAADVLRPFGIAAPLPIVMVLASLAWITRRAESVMPVAKAQAIDSCWRFPAFAFLTGTGLLWLTDYSARGYAKFQYLGLTHADTLFIGYMLLTVVAATQYHLLAFITRTLSRKHAEIWAWIALITWCCVIGSLSERGVLGKEFQSLTGQHLKAAITTELMRTAVFVAAGWIAYRWIGTRERTGFGLLQLAACGLVLIGGQALARDHGPILIFAAASGMVMGGLAGWGLARPLGAMAALPAITVAVGSAWAVHYGLIAWGSRVSHTIAERVAALDRPQQATSQFLSELQWFLASTPRNGHGLGKTPWCGDWAWLTNCTQGLHAGVPQQTQSDYVFVALAGVFGPIAAVAITLLTMAWLVSLIASRDNANTVAPQIASVTRLRDSIVAVFAVVTLMQLGVTVFGSLGVMPLTGVAFPLLGYGRAALLVTCIFAGLAMNRTIPTFPATTQ